MKESIMQRYVLVLGGALALLALGCSKDDAHASPRASSAPVAEPPPPPPPETAPAPAPTPSGSAQAVVEIEIGSVADTMAFDKTKLTVPAGAKVHLVLKNNGTIAAMTHNWVLVNAGTEAKVAAAALEKGPDAGYLALGPDVLASTTLAPPRGSVDITFNAPPPGKYPYICTFPGHYMMMKGELTVTP
jgi:azurin